MHLEPIDPRGVDSEGREAPSDTSWPRTHTLWGSNQGLSRLLLPYFYLLTQHDPCLSFSGAQMAVLGELLSLLPQYHSSNFISNSSDSTQNPCPFGQRQPCSVTIPPPMLSFPSHTQWWFLMLHPCRAERRRQIRKRSLMNSGVQEQSYQIGQDIASHWFSTFTMSQSHEWACLNRDFWAPSPKFLIQ